MLTTATRFCQAQDPTSTGVARVVRDRSAVVTAAAYPTLATAPSATGLGTAARPASTTGIATLPAAHVWNVIERKAMPKVDFHDRWPLHSTS